MIIAFTEAVHRGKFFYNYTQYAGSPIKYNYFLSDDQS